MSKTTIFSMILVAAVGCKSNESANTENPEPATNVDTEQVKPGHKTPDKKPKSGDTAPGTEAAPEAMAPTKPGDPAPLVAASNALAFDLYKTQRNSEGNLAFSPVSISLAFAMTYAGAAGPTAAEMKTTLHLPDDTLLEGAAAGLLSSWNSDDKGYELKVVNRLFGDSGYAFETPFLNTTKNTYQAPLERLDFQKDPEAQRAHINNWVLEQTADRIADLLPAESVTKDTRLILANAIYFLGKWKNAFDKKDTKTNSFAINGSSPADVPMMHQTSEFRVARVKGATLLQMPYSGGDLAMTIVLPTKENGLTKLEEELSTELYQSWKSKMHEQKVVVSLPSFEIKDATLPLKEALQSLGMNLPFTRAADFTKMANPSSDAEKLYIGNAFHKAFVKVDESGTEAAAATAVVMMTKGAAPEPPATFKADHPFLFTIENTKSGAILFVGRIVDPR